VSNSDRDAASCSQNEHNGDFYEDYQSSVLLGDLTKVLLEFVVKHQHERAAEAPPYIAQVTLKES